MTATIDNSMSPLSDLLQQIARRMAAHTTSPLVYVGDLTLPVAAPQTTPISPELSVAWRALLGETGLAWQAEALTVARRGGGIALMAAPPLGPATLLLLVAEQILDQTLDGVVVVVAPSVAALAGLQATLEQLNTLLGGALPSMVVDGRKRLPRTLPPLLLTTPEALHQRMLRLHDRAWARLWPQLSALVLPALDSSPGAKFGHLRWLLRRVARLRPSPRPPLIFTSLAPVADDAETVAAMVDLLPPIVRVGSSRFPLTWALWNGGGDPLKAALDLALALRQNGVSVQLAGRTPLEQVLIARRASDHGLPLAQLAGSPSTTLVLPGTPDVAVLSNLAASGYRSVVLVLDQSVAAQTAQHHPALLTPQTAPMLPVTLKNIYVDSAHVRCAAEECPLQLEEVRTWEALELVERLERKHTLAPLFGSETVWQPVAAPHPQDRDSYALVHPASASGGVVQVVDQENQPLGEIESALAERCLYPGAGVLGAVVDRWADDSTVVLNGQALARTRPERGTEVAIREELAQRPVDGARGEVFLSVGRVLVREQVIARRVVQSDGSVRRLPFEPSIDVQWSAPAVWMPLTGTSSAVGEILTGVLPLLLRCTADDAVACVADSTLYVVEAHPGGRGLAEYLYAHWEALLHLDLLAAQALRDDPLFKMAAQAELDWLNQVLMPLGAQKASLPTLPTTPRVPADPQVATSAEVTRRRFGRSRNRPLRQVVTPREAPPPPVVPPEPVEKSKPPLLLPAPAPRSAEPASARPARRTEPPAPPKRGKSKGKAKPARPVPAAESAPPAQQSGTSPLNESAPRSGASQVLPTRREPPPYERPPYQDRQPRRENPRPSQASMKPDAGRHMEPTKTPTEPRPTRRDVPPAPKQAEPMKTPTEPRPTRRDIAPPTPKQVPSEPSARSTRREPPIRSAPPTESRGSRNPAPRSDDVRKREQRESELRQSRPPAPKPKPAEQPTVEISTNPEELLAKARRLREQREAELKRNQPSKAQPPRRAPVEDEPVEGRFNPGDRVFCVPYGEGVVKKTRIRDGRELLLVQFADLGDLRVDPQVNAVRLIESAQEESDNE